MASIFKIKDINNYYTSSPTPGKITLMAGKPNLSTELLDSNLCKQIRDCGFNAVGATLTMSAIDESLKNCYNNRLSLFIKNNYLTENPKDFILRTKDKNGFGGWILDYAVNNENINSLKEIYKSIITANLVDSKSDKLYNPIYLAFSGDWNYDSANKSQSYTEFIERFQESFSPSFWPMIYFPEIVKSNDPNLIKSRIVNFYKSLQYMAYVSRYTAAPFWLVCRCQAFYNYYGFNAPPVSENVLRGIVFTALSYGVQGIYYWDYRNSYSSSQRFFNAPVNRDGDKTPTWDIVQKVNNEINAFNSVFNGCEMLDCRHVKPVDNDGYIRILSHPMGPLISVNNATGNLLVSHIFTKKNDDEGTNYLIIVADPFSSISIDFELEFSNYWRIYEHIYIDKIHLTSSLLNYKFNSKLAPGAYRIFHWT